MKSAIESLYIGKMDIYEYVNDTDPITHITHTDRGVKINDEPIPCRLSHTYNRDIEKGDGGELVQSIKVFVSSDINIKPNSTLVITQHGRKNVYVGSSMPRVYTHHQEIELRLKEGWA